MGITRRLRAISHKAAGLRQAVRLGGLLLFMMYAGVLFAWVVGSLYADPAYAKKIHALRYSTSVE